MNRRGFFTTLAAIAAGRKLPGLKVGDRFTIAQVNLVNPPLTLSWRPLRFHPAAFVLEYPRLKIGNTIRVKEPQRYSTT